MKCCFGIIRAGPIFGGGIWKILEGSLMCLNHTSEQSNV